MNFLVHFPLLQPIISLSYLLEIQAIDDKILENKTNYKKFESAETYMDQSNRKVCRKTALGCSRTNTRLKKLRIALVSEHLDTRMYEAFLESGPQASLQIMVVMSQGFSGYMHLASILTSLGSLTSYANDMFLEYPTKVSLEETCMEIGTKLILYFQNYALREMSSIWPHFHVHILMGVIVLGRVFCLSLTFAMYRTYALLPLGLYFLIIFAYALWTNKKNQDMVDTFKVFLATFTSMFAPCMIMIDNSMYYFVNATIGNLFYALSIWPLFWIMTSIRKFYIQ